MNTFSHLIRIDLHCCLNFFKDEYFSSILEVSMMQKRNWHICLLLPVLYDAPHATCQSVLWVDFDDGQFLIAMRCRCFLYNSDAMSRVFGHYYHRNRCDYFCSTIGTDCFPLVFSNFRTDVWGWFFVGNPWTTYFTTCSNLQKWCVCQCSGGKTSPQAKRHKPTLLFTSLTILTFTTR